MKARASAVASVAVFLLGFAVADSSALPHKVTLAGKPVRLSPR